MTKNQLEQKRTGIAQWAIRHGYAPDRWGHYTKVDEKGRKWRLSVTKSSVRIEYQVITVMPWGKEYQWHRHSSGYLRDIEVTPAGDYLKGVTPHGCQPKEEGK